MRRYSRPLIIIALLVTLAGLVLGFQEFSIGNFERGDDTLLGLRLGLDLQGGSHLVYQAVDRDTGVPMIPEETEMESLLKLIKDRVNASGLGEPNIQILGDDRLLIQLPGIRDPGRAKALIGETAQLVFKHRRLNVPRPIDEISQEDIVSITAGALPEDGVEPQEAEGEEPEVSTTPEAAGLEEPEVVTAAESAEAEGEEPTEAEQPQAGATPGASEPEAQATQEEAEDEPVEQEERPPVLLVELTEQGAREFNEVLDRLSASFSVALSSATGPSDFNPSTLEVAVEGEELLRFSANSLTIQRIDGGNSYAFQFPFPAVGEGGNDLQTAQALLGSAPTIEMTEIQAFVDETPDEGSITGDDVARAYYDQDSAGLPIVALEFKSEGTRVWGKLTERLAGKGATDRIAIFLDDRELIAPRVTTPITTGVTSIQGGRFTVQYAKDLALQIESGALPLTIELIQERDVDAILGADSLKKSVIAGSAGLLLVLLFMVLYYRVPGLVSAVALMIYAPLVLALFKIIPMTLTLSGVSAVILSIGMAVDANILIFERMKEELRAGRTLLSSINIGFNRAWPAIRDGNVSTLITCGILFYFSNQLGTTEVQGFAVALAIGVLVSLFSAITVSRTLLRVVATTPLSRRLDLFVPSGGADLPQKRQQAAASAVPGS